MKLGYTILYVEDVAGSLAFYERAFDLRTVFLDEGGDFGQLDTGDTALAFCSRRLLRTLGKHPAAPDRNAPCFEIAFTTDDVPAAYARAVAAGAIPIQAPETVPWGQIVAYVADPNDFLVEICTPVGG